MPADGLHQILRLLESSRDLRTRRASNIRLPDEDRRITPFLLRTTAVTLHGILVAIYSRLLKPSGIRSLPTTFRFRVYLAR